MDNASRDAEAKARRVVAVAERNARDFPLRLAEWLRRRDRPGLARLAGAITIDSPLVLSFCALCVVLHAVGAASGEHFARDTLGIWPWSHFRARRPRSWLQFVTHVVGHVNWTHLQGNLVNMLLVGPQCEREYGTFNLLKIILWTALFSGLAHMALGASNGVQLGASGVVFSLILLSSLVAAHDQRVPLTFVANVVVWCWTEIGATVFSGNGSDRTSHLAHLSGAVVGTIAGYYLHAGGAERPGSPAARGLSWWRRLMRRGAAP